MRENEAVTDYLTDLGQLLKEQALEAKRSKDSAQNDERAFELGRLMGYHEVISLMQQQATAFGIALEDVNLAGIDPEKDLL